MTFMLAQPCLGGSDCPPSRVPPQMEAGHGADAHIESYAILQQYFQAEVVQQRQQRQQQQQQQQQQEYTHPWLQQTRKQVQAAQVQEHDRQAQVQAKFPTLLLAQELRRELAERHSVPYMADSLGPVAFEVPLPKFGKFAIAGQEVMESHLVAPPGLAWEEECNDDQCSVADSKTIKKRARRPKKKSIDGHCRFWTRFIFQISKEQAKSCELVPKLIGFQGENMKTISAACEAKLRIRGQGSLYKEVRGPKGMKEACMPLQLCLSCPTQVDLDRASVMVRALIDKEAQSYAQQDSLPDPPSPFYVEMPGRMEV